MANGYRKNYLKKLKDGGSLYEADLLAIILGNAFGGKDMSVEARALLTRFPGIRAILEADISEITAVDGISDSVAAYLKTLGLAVKFNQKSNIEIKNTQQCIQFASSRLTGKDNEYVEMYFVNRSGKITDIRSFTSDNADKVDIAANRVLAIISSAQAYGLYFVHNHVNASAKPSANDDIVTDKIRSACAMCGVKFFDHCIVSSTGDKFSYAESGRMKGQK
ncbi:MAG: hypothetical protein K2N14_03440 [Clostridia bacterium]|nr:hypothetical protein [Clostridia bacterium]